MERKILCKDMSELLFVFKFYVYFKILNRLFRATCRTNRKLINRNVHHAIERIIKLNTKKYIFDRLLYYFVECGFNRKTNIITTIIITKDMPSRNSFENNCLKTKKLMMKLMMKMTNEATMMMTMMMMMKNNN